MFQAGRILKSQYKVSHQVCLAHAIHLCATTDVLYKKLSTRDDNVDDDVDDVSDVDDAVLENTPGHVFMDDLDTQSNEVSDDDNDDDERFILEMTPLDELFPDISSEFSSSLQKARATVKFFKYDLRNQFLQVF